MDVYSSSEVRDCLAACFVRQRSPHRHIVLEGAPGAGKTTAARDLSAQQHVFLIPQLDHSSTHPSLLGLDVQEWYIHAERDRQKLVWSALQSSHVLQDRNVLSTLAFAYATSRLMRHTRMFQLTMRLLVRTARGALVCPDVLMLLYTAPRIGLARRRASGGEPANPLWSNFDFLTCHAEFYQRFSAGFPSSDTVELDTTHMEPAELAAIVAKQMPEC